MNLKKSSPTLCMTIKELVKNHDDGLRLYAILYNRTLIKHGKIIGSATGRMVGQYIAEAVGNGKTYLDYYLAKYWDDVKTEDVFQMWVKMQLLGYDVIEDPFCTHNSPLFRNLNFRDRWYTFVEGLGISKPLYWYFARKDKFYARIELHRWWQTHFQIWWIK